MFPLLLVMPQFCQLLETADRSTCSIRASSPLPSVRSRSRDKQIVDTFRLVVAHKRLTKVGIFENCAESIQILFEDFVSVGHKE